MGWRFRNSVKLLPGVRLHFSKSGISTSVGGPGATINFGKQGTRSTLGLPGSGISYSELHSSAPAGNGDQIEQSVTSNGCGCWSIILLIVLVFMLWRCGEGDQSKVNDTAPAQRASSQFSSPSASTETVYVSANTLNGRSEPSTSSAIVSRLNRGDRLDVLDRQGEWTKVIKAGVTFWIATKYISASFVAAEPQRQPSALMDSKPSAIKSNRQRRGGGGICPCSTGKVCIGPRGGRYCITSGGNKQYGV
jgi:Protein of unknown function (DUF4236)/Bacterial SH3 domain